VAGLVVLILIWNNIQERKVIITMGHGGGINTYRENELDLTNEELTDTLNMSADAYPAVRTRNDRALMSPPQSTKALWGMGRRYNTYLHVLEDNTWKYAAPDSTAWNEISTGITAPGLAAFIEFNTQTERVTIIAYSTGVVYNSYWDGVTYSTFSDTNSPRSNLYTAHRYRLYGVENDGRTLRYSAQGDWTDFTTADDAGYLDITEVQGTITAITTFADHPIIWSANSMHELYGTDPDNFELVNISYVVGCVARFAYTETDGKLFWMDYNGIYMYTGGLPKKIAEKANGIISKINWDYKHLIRAGGIGDKLYFLIPYDGATSINRILVIDLVNDRRSPYVVNIEGGNWNSLIQLGEKLYGMDSTGNIWDMHSTAITGYDNGSVINWGFETKPFTDEINNESAVRDLWVRYQCGSTNATMQLAYTTQNDSTSFTALAATSDFSAVTYEVRKQIVPPPTALQGMGYMKFRYSGSGNTRISGTKMNIITYGEVI
jgi:hypothetical protein